MKDGFWLAGAIVLALVSLLIGAGIGIMSVQTRIRDYGCEAYVKAEMGR